MGEINRSSSRFFHIPSDGSDPAVLPDIPSALSMLTSGGYIWLNFLDPGREELMLLAEPLGLRKSITHEREILVKICRKDSPFISEKTVYHFRDVYDHLAKFFEQTEIYRELISGFMEMYLSMMNNRMTLVANRTNRVIHRLTMITTIFMPLTLLSGIGGMSEWSMMTGQENWRIAYPLFLLGMAIIGIITYKLLLKIQSKDLDK